MSKASTQTSLQSIIAMQTAIINQQQALINDLISRVNIDSNTQTKLDSINAAIKAIPHKTEYIYIITFHGRSGVFKAGKTKNMYERMNVYISHEAKQYGQSHVIRCGAVDDSLDVESKLQEQIRAYVKKHDEHQIIGNAKSKTTSEWYQIDQAAIESIFDDILNKYGMKDSQGKLYVDDTVRRYDQRRIPELLELKRYSNIELQSSIYYYNPSMDAVYQRWTNGFDSMRCVGSTLEYAMNDANGDEVRIKRTWLKSHYKSMSGDKA